MIKPGYNTAMTAAPDGSTYHCATLQFLCCVYLSFHAHRYYQHYLTTNSYEFDA